MINNHALSIKIENISRRSIGGNRYAFAGILDSDFIDSKPINVMFFVLVKCFPNIENEIINSNFKTFINRYFEYLNKEMLEIRKLNRINIEEVIKEWETLINNILELRGTENE